MQTRFVWRRCDCSVLPRFFDQSEYDRIRLGLVSTVYIADSGRVRSVWRWLQLDLFVPRQHLVMELLPVFPRRPPVRMWFSVSVRYVARSSGSPPDEPLDRHFVISLLQRVDLTD